MARNRQRAKQRKAKQQSQGGRPADAVTNGAAETDAAPAQDRKPKINQVESAKVLSADDSGKKAKPAKRADSAPRERGRVTGFFRSVWAELKRVQWPDRRQIVTLTSVVIAFVIIAGAYLGLVDVIAKQIVDVTIF